MATKKTATKKQSSEKKGKEMTSWEIEKAELRRRGLGLGLQSGGRATHGYGKAYLKGGKV